MGSPGLCSSTTYHNRLLTRAPQSRAATGTLSEGVSGKGVVESTVTFAHAILSRN